MQILAIRLVNVKSHRDTELSFAPGINVLSGPNGVGKSTVFEAIGYALFGVDASSFVGNVERFLTIGARRGEVAVTFRPRPDGELFRVSRTLGTPSKWLLAKECGGAFEVEEHKDGRETEARLKELLGLDNGRSLADQFTLVIGPFQHDFLGPFVIRQAAKRRDEFDAILGIDTWRQTYHQTKTLATALKGRSEALAAALGPLREQAAALPEALAAHAAALATLELAGGELAQRREELVDLELALAECDRREQLVKGLELDLERLCERLANGRGRIDSQQQLIAEAEEAGRVVAANAAGKAAHERAEQELAGLREREKELRRLEKETAGLAEQAGRLAGQLAAEERGVEQARHELQAEAATLASRSAALAADRRLEEQAAALPGLREAIAGLRGRAGELAGVRAGLVEGSDKLAAGACPFFQEPCQNLAARPPGDVFAAKLAGLAAEEQRLSAELAGREAEELAARSADEQLKALAVQRNELAAQEQRLAARWAALDARAAGLARLTGELSEVQGRLAGKRGELLAHAGLPAAIESAEAALSEHRPARDLYLARLEVAATLAERRAGLERFEALLTQLGGELADKSAALAAARGGYDGERHRALREQQSALRTAVGALGEKLDRYRADSARLAGEIERLRRVEAEIAAKEEQARGAARKEELVKFLRNRVFKQVSTHLSERFREEISLRADRIYRTIAESDEELHWGEDYRIVLRDLAEGALRERSDDQLSGGQTMSAVVALRLAMLQTIGARIAFFDEPTSNLDAARRENLARAFRAIDVGREEVTEHWYDQLFLISHDVAFTEITDQLVDLAAERRGGDGEAEL